MATNFMPAPDDEDADWPLPRWVEGDSLAPFQSCQPETVEAILRLAKVTKDDVLYDLGCGDGRVCIGASKQYGAKAVGVEIDPDVADLARRKVEEAGVGDLTQILTGDALQIPLENCTVCVMFLLPDGLIQMSSHLQSLLKRDNTRIVSVCFSVKGWTPSAEADNPHGTNKIYMYTKESISA